MLIPRKLGLNNALGAPSDGETVLDDRTVCWAQTVLIPPHHVTIVGGA